MKVPKNSVVIITRARVVVTIVPLSLKIGTDTVIDSVCPFAFVIVF